MVRKRSRVRFSQEAPSLAIAEGATTWGRPVGLVDRVGQFVHLMSLFEMGLTAVRPFEFVAACFATCLVAPSDGTRNSGVQSSWPSCRRLDSVCPFQGLLAGDRVLTGRCALGTAIGL